jgi:hypothetical protein
MRSMTLLDTCGRRRSPATLPGFHQDRPPRNKGLRYPAGPPTVEEIVAVMRAAGHDAEAVRVLSSGRKRSGNHAVPLRLHRPRRQIRAGDTDAHGC